MLLNDLDAVLRSAGLTVTEASGWQGHNHGAMTSVECIVIHHTAGAATGDYPSHSVVRNGRPGLGGPLAQLGVGRSGRVYVFSNGVAWHAGTTLQRWQDNYHSIGIEVESVGTGAEWPLVQVHATAKAAAALCRRYGVPSSRVLGHKEICSPPGRKVDPVGIIGDMRGFRSLVQYYINNPDGDEMNEQQYAVLVETQRRVTLAKTTTEQVKSLVDTLEPKVAALQADLAASRAVDVENQRRIGLLTEKVDQLALNQGGGGTPVNVDVDAFCALLVPQLAAALRAAEDQAARDGDPTTGPVS